MDLLSILEEPQVKEALSELRKGYSRQFDDGSDELTLEVWGHLLHMYGGRREFADLVAPRLSRPAKITVDDLSTAFVHHVLTRNEAFEQAYEEFCLAADALTRIYRQSEPIPTFVYERLHQTHELNQAQCGVLWSREDEMGARVAITVAGLVRAGPLVPVDPSEQGPTVPYVTLEGYFTEAALREATREIGDVVTTLLKSFYILEDVEFTPWLKWKRTRRPDPHHAESQWPKKDSVALPILNLHELRELLDSYFGEPTKKDSLARRIRNAVHLLVEADRQSTNGIGLALSVVAMETLLCRKGDGLANMLAENVAVLLEPELAHRRSAEEFVKELYDKRSSVLHGSVTDFPADDLWKARFLSSGVLKAFVARRVIRRASGEIDQTPDDLLRELKDRKYTAGHALWDPDSPVVELWR